MKQSLQFERAQSMVFADKFNYRQSEFFRELSKFVAAYMDCDGITVQAYRGKSNDLVITLSVKRIRPTSRPQV